MAHRRATPPVAADVDQHANQPRFLMRRTERHRADRLRGAQIGVLNQIAGVFRVLRQPPRQPVQALVVRVEQRGEPLRRVGQLDLHRGGPDDRIAGHDRIDAAGGHCVGGVRPGSDPDGLCDLDGLREGRFCVPPPLALKLRDAMVPMRVVLSARRPRSRRSGRGACGLSSSCGEPPSARTAPRPEPAAGQRQPLGEPRFDLRQRGEHDVAHDLQAARADRVERVLRRVPRLVVEVDDVDGRHAGREERQVVVLDARRLRRRSSCPARAAWPRPRRCRSATAWNWCRAGSSRSRSPIMSTRTIALSVASDPSRFARPRRSGGCRRCCRCPASPSRRASSPSRNTSSIVNAFLRALSTRAISMRNAALDPPSLAPTKRNSRDQLRVVVAGDDQAILVGSGNRDDEVHHVDRVDRRAIVPRLFDGREPVGGELALDVLPRLLDGRRSRRPRPDRHQLPQVFPGAARSRISAAARRGLQRQQRRGEAASCSIIDALLPAGRSHVRAGPV